MLLVSLFSLFSVGFGVRIWTGPNTLELGPLLVATSSTSALDNLEDEPDVVVLLPTTSDVSREKRGVDPLSIPRLIKEPPLKKRSDFKRGDVVYPSAAKQTVPLVRVREPPLKRGQLFLEDLLKFSDSQNKRFQDPMRRLRYGSNRHIFSW